MLEALASLLSVCWRFFSDVKVPGLDVPFSALLIGGILIRLSISIKSSALGTSPRSGGSRNVKISDNRKGDEY